MERFYDEQTYSQQTTAVGYSQFNIMSIQENRVQAIH